MSVGIIKLVSLVATDTPVYINHIATQGMLFMIFIISVMFWSLTFVMNKTICSLFGLLSVTVVLLSFGVQNETIDTIGGYFGIATSINAFWLAYVELVNDVIGKGTIIIPVGQWNWTKKRPAINPIDHNMKDTQSDLEVGDSGNAVS